MPFRSIVGHHRVVDLLARAVARDSLPPSLILSGPEGVGKRRVALALAQAVNCLKPVTGESGVRNQESGARSPEPGARSQESGIRRDACGECGACRRIERGIHPDVLLVDEKGVHPEVLDVEVKEGSAVIPVGVVREVTKVARFRPYEGRRRVVIIDPADVMERPYGQNALLKILEETPPATVFLLVTARPDVLLPTIRSRCPQIRFGALSVAEITEVLTRERGLSERAARAAAIVAAGSVARALEAASEETTGARSQALAVLQEAATARDPRRLFEQMKAVLGLDRRQGTTPAAEREDVTLSLRALSSLLRDVTLMQAAPEPPSGAALDLANADLKKDLERVAASFGRQRVVRAFAAVDRALAALSGNANPKLVVDWLAFQM
jgi:DNA polymerase-3 subunit delta'